jgi:GR25 family glycosyltransferase involved in LPS biosynthesis
MALALNTIKDITNVVYINLDSRPDRKAHVENQLRTVGFPSFERFKAIKTTNGAIGCSMSHLKCLTDARSQSLSHLLICEDDTTFLNPELFRTQFNAFLKKNHPWDVALIAGNNVLPYQNIDETCIKVTHCQTTTCYLVNGRYFTTLIDNITAGLYKLMQNPRNRFHYAIDKYWLQLQKYDNWYLIIPLTVIQQEGYSDIEKRTVKYADLMTNMHKAIAVPSPLAASSPSPSENKHSIKNILNSL